MPLTLKLDAICSSEMLTGCMYDSHNKWFEPRRAKLCVHNVGSSSTRILLFTLITLTAEYPCDLAGTITFQPRLQSMEQSPS
jgi:hypothetical protein